MNNRSDEGRRRYWFAFRSTAILVGGLSLLSTAGGAVAGLYLFWIAAVAAWLLAILVLVTFLIAGQRSVASGIVAGIAVGLLALAVTCFVNVQTIDF